MQKSTLAIAFSLILAAQAAANVTGHVTCQGRGVEGVVVSDGIDCVITDKQGAYTIASNRGARFVQISTPSGYKVACKQNTLPQFYHPIDAAQPDKTYDFELIENPLDNGKFIFFAQADPQFTDPAEIVKYSSMLDDINNYAAHLRSSTEMFAVDCGDIVGDSPHLYPAYIDTVAKLDMPVYRTIGNHDMTYGGRSFQTSYAKFEETFGPANYSFNKGNAHFIVMDDCFYLDRDYQHIGYLDESILAWLEEDLKFVPKDRTLFILLHIPSSNKPEIPFNQFSHGEVANAKGLYEMIDGYNVHIVSGHYHTNHNVVFNERRMEHITAAVCGIWWCSDTCSDGSPAGYGIYEVDGNDVKWTYKGFGQPLDYQFRAYPVGASEEYPTDITANVWNYDTLWSVEWLEDGNVMGEMEQFRGFDPQAAAICRDRSIVKYEWIAPHKNPHMFHATPVNPNAKITVRVTDRFGRVYTQEVK